MRIQYRATVEFHRAVRAGDPLLALFRDIPAILIDTTDLNMDQVYERGARFVDDIPRQPRVCAETSEMSVAPSSTGPDRPIFAALAR
jgi:hypothetical protein